MKKLLKNWKLQSLLLSMVLALPQTSSALTVISATTDASNLYYTINYLGSPTYIHVFIDTDKNASTGYSKGGIGADYMVENDILYKFSGSTAFTWSWKAVASSNMVKLASAVKFKIAQASVGNPSALNVVENTSAGDTSGIVAQDLSSTPLVTYSFCANQNGVCSFMGMKAVRYGSGSSYVTKTIIGPVACNNTTFGNPIRGIKHCDVISIIASPPLPTPVPVPVPVPFPLPTPTTTPSPITSSVSFSASNAVIINPERGFFMTTDCRANPLSVSQLQNYKSQYEHSVFNCLWYLREFKNSPISATVLEQLQTQMNNVRTAGFKMILRFAYTNTDSNDAPLSIVQGHLDQLAPLLRNNSDIIATIQAGIIGQWAEMSTSANFGGTSGSFTATDWANRKAVIDKLLAVVPSSRMVAVRTPEFKMQPYGIAALSDAEAFNETARARVGHYNDCFLSSSNDWGTYRGTADRDFLKQDSKFLATSGETCALAAQNDCDNAVAEMAQMHWSLLHEGYNVDVINKWKSQGCFATIQSRLGYRFQLQDATLSTSANVGGAIAVSINIVNVGFAALYNERPVQIILRHVATGALIRMPLNVDPRRWLPGSVIKVSQALNIPSTAIPGTYAVLLAFPDAAQGLANRSEYSIQLANTGIWESSTGFNNLKTNLVISP
jgi:hypothetical protein